MSVLTAGKTELSGAIVLLLGLLIRPAALLLAITIVVAIFSVHFANGLFLSNKSYEFALALLAALLSLLVSGAGKLSPDRPAYINCIEGSVKIEGYPSPDEKDAPEYGKPAWLILH